MRLLEDLAPIDVEAAAAHAVATIAGESEWKAEDMARRKEEAEAAADEDSEEVLVSAWVAAGIRVRVGLGWGRGTAQGRTVPRTAAGVRARGT